MRGFAYFILHVIPVPPDAIAGRVYHSVRGAFQRSPVSKAETQTTARREWRDQRAESPSHRTTSTRMERAYSPVCIPRALNWGCAPGSDSAAPLALGARRIWRLIARSTGPPPSPGNRGVLGALVNGSGRRSHRLPRPCRAPATAPIGAVSRSLVRGTRRTGPGARRLHPGSDQIGPGYSSTALKQ